MSTPRDIAHAMQRAVGVFTRRPDMGLHDDAAARASWQHGTRIVAAHACGTRIESDMPVELGGTGDRPSPGWFFRAGIAACTATAITMVAAEQGIALDHLEVEVGSRSDTRGLLGMRDADGVSVGACPASMRVDVVLHAQDVEAERLHAVVQEALRRSPMQGALLGQPPLTVDVATTPARAA
ncbi:OsmC family protein [Pseudoxanthomonas sp. PXM03]|uniref:OsmC family protein n=1 Tax=Pseudoxanthomonas sp. PXM03 TaxID=2769284 RepID=UPI00178250B1|nr:OsmC family protein [Pseudoxanthomonas sp. PXM03]MBD9435971.1 OsmC family protein [Pseudoxanthomonas sp. PXM03]